VNFLRVLHAFKVFPPDVTGGIPQVIASLAKGMSPRHESSVLIARSRGWGRRYVLDGIPVEALGSLGTVLSSPISPSFPFSLADRSRQADLVAFHHPSPLNDFAAMIGLPIRTALVVHWHAEIVARWPLADLVAPFIRHTLARAQRIVVCHSSLLSVSPFLGAHRAKCAIIPYGIDAPFWSELDGSQQSKVEALRSRYPRLVMATGRLVPYKGFHVLIEALRQVNATAIIVGEGRLREDLSLMARRLGMEHRILLAGALSRDDLKIHLHSARLFALPSVSAAETFGIAQVEAMAAGLPIVNTDLPTAVPHVARHGLEALTVPPNDPAALAAAITRLLDDEKLSRRLGAVGRARAITEYKLDTFSTRIEEVYQKALHSISNAAREGQRERVE
jgi:glycosyltransferase involved in cell wall biosynthesis